MYISLIRLCHSSNNNNHPHHNTTRARIAAVFHCAAFLCRLKGSARHHHHHTPSQPSTPRGGASHALALADIPPVCRGELRRRLATLLASLQCPRALAREEVDAMRRDDLLVRACVCFVEGVFGICSLRQAPPSIDPVSPTHTCPTNTTTHPLITTTT